MAAPSWHENPMVLYAPTLGLLLASDPPEGLGKDWVSLRTSGALPIREPVVGFAAGAMLPEEAIAGADRGAAVAGRVPGKADARRRIEQVVGHAAVGHAVHAALHQAIGDDGVKIVQVQPDWRQSAAGSARPMFRTRKPLLGSTKKDEPSD